MTNINKQLAAAMLNDAPAPEEVIHSDQKVPITKVNRVGTRVNIATQDRVEKVLFKVDPDQCVLWASHNRRYDLLNESRCQDLIDGFISQGQQEFPAIAREIVKDGKSTYEVICGARRLWTVRWLRQNDYADFKFLIERRKLSDEEAFRLSDVENRDKEDISDYERAVDYKKALGNWYNTQLQMATRLKMDPGWLSKLIYLAELPKEIVAAYKDVTQIRVKHSETLKKLLRNKTKQPAILKKAEEIIKLQESSTRLIPGFEVLKLLTSATRDKKKAEQERSYKNNKGDKMLTVKKNTRGIVVTVPHNLKKTEVIKAFRTAIEEMLN